MASRFDRQFKAFAFPGLLAEFGEAIVYHPAGGGSRSIAAIIERSPPALFDAAGNTVLASFLIRVKNDHDSGISSKELNSGGDMISFYARVDDVQMSKKSITRKMSDDSGVLVVAVN